MSRPVAVVRDPPARARVGARGSRSLSLVRRRRRGAARPPTGKIQGKIVATDTGEPIGFADVLLIPADTTHAPRRRPDERRRHVPARGRRRAATRCRSARSRTPRKRDRGHRARGRRAAAVQHRARRPRRSSRRRSSSRRKARQNTEASLLAARKKAAVGRRRGERRAGAQVARQGRRRGAAPRHRALGLRRQVRVRARPRRALQLDRGRRRAHREPRAEQARRAARPAARQPAREHRRAEDLHRRPPGRVRRRRRAGAHQGLPGQAHLVVLGLAGLRRGRRPSRTGAPTPSTGADIFGFGADSREIPDAVYDVAGDRPLVQSSDPTRGFTKATLAAVASSFTNVWSPDSAAHDPERAATRRPTATSSSCSAARSGVIASWNLSRSFDQQRRVAALLPERATTRSTTTPSTRSTESVQLGGISGLSYRLSPRHTLHLRGLYTNSADDEVRIYEGAGPQPRRGHHRDLAGPPRHAAHVRAAQRAVGHARGASTSSQRLFGTQPRLEAHAARARGASSPTAARRPTTTASTTTAPATWSATGRWARPAAASTAT